MHRFLLGFEVNKAHFSVNRTHRNTGSPRRVLSFQVSEDIGFGGMEEGEIHAHPYGSNQVSEEMSLEDDTMPASPDRLPTKVFPLTRC